VLVEVMGALEQLVSFLGLFLGNSEQGSHAQTARPRRHFSNRRNEFVR
jgi:hypothetical protein